MSAGIIKCLMERDSICVIACPKKMKIRFTLCLQPFNVQIQRILNFLATKKEKMNCGNYKTESENVFSGNQSSEWQQIFS